MPKITSLRSTRKPQDRAPTIPELRQLIVEQSCALVSFTIGAASEETTFRAFERELRERVFALGRTLIVVFLTRAEERLRNETPTREERSGRLFQRTRARGRNLTTWFGTVRYWRTYMKQLGTSEGHGFFPLDVVHVVEKLWEAGACFLREGSKELAEWVEARKKQLYAGDVKALLSDLRRARRTLGRGKKKASRRERMLVIINYIRKRKAMMSYAALMDEDLEVGSGAVEGAVKNAIGKRCDQGGMRWITERVEAVVQLRCIELNGDWDRFVDHVHDRVQQRGIEHGTRIRIQRKEAAPLPKIEEAA